MSKNVSFDILDDIIYKYNNTYYRTSKWGPLMLRQVHILTLIFEKNNDKGSKFIVGDHVRI